MKCIAAYMPGLHEGYLKFFAQHQDVSTLLVFGPELIKEFDHLRKDIRALDPDRVVQAIQSWGIFQTVGLLDSEAIARLNHEKPCFIMMPDEPESHEIARKYFSTKLEDGYVQFDPIFLRWDMKKSQAEQVVEANRIVSSDQLHQSFMTSAIAQSEKSIDWWRQIGAVLVKDGQLLMTIRNEPATSSHYLHLFGDPRSNFKRGMSIELSLFDHAEAAIVGMAAAEGIALRGAELYVTTFPCPPCAKLIGQAGIKRLFFKEGYSKLDGEDVLRRHKVEVVRVE